MAAEIYKNTKCITAVGVYYVYQAVASPGWLTKGGTGKKCNDAGNVAGKRDMCQQEYCLE